MEVLFVKWKVKINGTFFIVIIFLLVALSLYTFLYSKNENYTRYSETDTGILELSQNELDYNLSLKGKWKYYEGELHQSTDTITNNYELVTIPHVWNGTGYGTYQMTLTGLTPGECYSFYIYDVNSAYEFYIDGQSIANSGQVGKTHEEEIVDLKPQLAKFSPTTSEANLFFTISSYHLSPGGFYKQVEVGLFNNIVDKLKRNVASQMILFGSLLVLSVYNLSLFLVNTEERSGAYFALFIFFTALRVPFIGERLINTWINNPNWLSLVRIVFLSSSLMFASLMVFMYNIYKSHFNKKVFLAFIGAITCFTILVFLLPLNKLASLDIAFLLLAVVYFIYLMYVVISSIKAGVQGSVFSFIGISFILGTILLDTTLPAGNNVISIGILIFLIFHSLVIAEKYAHIMEQNKLLHQVATRDDMTNFFKKEHFNQVIGDIISSGDSLMHHSIMFVDIDNFKNINDSYGHDVGDEVIITIAERILKSLRYSDIACRYGGDEFVLWLQNTKTQEANDIATRILDHVSDSIIINKTEINISVSIGIALYPDDGVDLNTLLKVCDKRMYLAKSKGKNQFVLD